LQEVVIFFNADTPLLTTASADLGQVVEKNYLSSIPVNLARNGLNTVRLAPGVTGGGATVSGNHTGSFSSADSSVTRSAGRSLSHACVTAATALSSRHAFSSDR
jgi:hypothetical protein